MLHVAFSVCRVENQIFEKPCQLIGNVVGVFVACAVP